MPRIRIAWPQGEVTAHLSDTPTARQLLSALPVEAAAHVWGEEVYFAVPVNGVLEADARQVVDAGSVCFWVEGGSLALPYGRTPVSHNGEPRLVTRCNVLGRIDGDPRQLAAVKPGVKVRVELLPDRE